MVNKWTNFSTLCGFQDISGQSNKYQEFQEFQDSAHLLSLLASTLLLTLPIGLVVVWQQHCGQLHINRITDRACAAESRQRPINPKLFDLPGLYKTASAHNHLKYHPEWTKALPLPRSLLYWGEDTPPIPTQIFTEIKISDVTVEDVLSMHNQLHNIPVCNWFQMELVSNFLKYICKLFNANR